ncbi:hemolysin activation/secretion protein [Ciceribacter lividus]|uniref:Hemolysin activation/secretion protein n=1 Tax=Ciceribacter lividus TaxID=1197950 RepID=A0A6I7HHI6_9HYPH|nr:ShlB/FhaC/HecB family hemolysin secretion/activation protein [Ciceribacter lividus]RCW20641.1 hemolysin activation/secretion protein [Ciceribacter lividus]
MRKLLNISVSALTLGLAMSASSGLAHAQTASQLTEKSYAPPVIKAVKGGLALPGSTGVEAPAGAERLHVTPSGLVVDGSLPGMETDTAAVEGTIAGKTVTGADLFKAASDLEAAYVRAGYLLVRVSLPPQTLKNGQPLKLVVTDGYVEAIDASALSGKARTRVEAVLAPLAGSKGLTKRELERRLLLAGDTPGVMLKSTLKAGSKPGATIIVVDGRYDAVTVSSSVDNSLSSSMGSIVASTGFDFNNLLGLGEAFYLRLNGYPGFGSDNIVSADPRNRQIVAGLTMPIGTDGLWAGLEAVDSRTHPTSSLGYTMADHYQRLSSKLGYNWVRSRDFNTASIIAFDIADEKQQIVMSGTKTDYNEDRLRVLRLTQSADYFYSFGGHVSGDITASFGMNALGARTATSALPMSRDGASPSFSKLEASLRYTQPFADGRVQWLIAAHGQTSFGDALAASEQMGLGGMSWLSAFDSGAVQGDAGFAVRSELSFPQIFTPFASKEDIGAVAAPYVFGAAGVAKLENPTSVETAVTRAISFGAGLRLALSQQASSNAANLTLEYAHGAANGMSAKNRINVRFSVSF